MNLGQVIAELEAWAAEAGPDHVAVFGIANPHSWRGDYSEVAFEPVTNVSVGLMLEHARAAVGATYQGWKGGYYTMDVDTSAHVALTGTVNWEQDQIQTVTFTVMRGADTWPQGMPGPATVLLRPEGDIPEGRVLCPECNGRVFYGPLLNPRQCSTCYPHGHTPAGAAS